MASGWLIIAFVYLLWETYTKARSGIWSQRTQKNTLILYGVLLFCESYAFGQTKDLDAYPETLQDECKLLEALGS